MNSEMLDTPRRTSGLVRHLTVADVVLMVVATPAASGIVYYSVSKAAVYPGGSVWLAFLIGMILFLPICIVVAAGSAAAPRAGGLYVFVSRVLGPRLGFVAAMLFFFGYSLTIGVLGGIVVRLLSGLFQTMSGPMAESITGRVARILSNDHVVFAGGVVWVAIFWLVCSFGLKLFRPVARLVYIVPLVATVVVVMVFVLESPSSFSSSFDSVWGNGASASIMKLAGEKGWSPRGFSWSDTMALLLVVLWAFGGVEMAGYVSGEVRSARRSMFIGYLVGWAILGLLYIVLSASVYHATGTKFPVAYAYLYDNHPTELETLLGFNPPAPSVPFYLVSILGRTATSVVLVICLILWFVNTMPGFYLGLSRLLFALGLDGQLPAHFKSYSSRWRTPTVANHATAVVGVVGCILYAYHNSSVLATIDFLIYFFVWLYGLSALVYAFERSGPLDSPVLQKRFAGVPVLAVFGLVVFLEGWLFVFLTLNGLSWATRGWLIGAFAVIGVLILVRQRYVANTGIDESAIYVAMPLDADEHPKASI